MAKWKPNRAEAQEYKEQIEKINKFVEEKGITKSLNGSSYYFQLNGQFYRVSNHTIEASNKGAEDEFGNILRAKYHQDGGDPNVTYITASKMRIIEIYTNLEKGLKLNKRGQVI